MLEICHLSDAERSGLVRVVETMRGNGFQLCGKNDGYFIQAPQGPIHYRYYAPEAEPKAVILALHGAGNNGAFFHDFAMQAVRENYVVYAPDFPGHGASSWRQTYDYRAIAEETVYTFGQLQEKHGHNSLPVFGLGASFGGHIMMMAQDRIDFQAVTLNDIGPRVEAETHRSAVRFFRSQKSYDTLDTVVEYCDRKFRGYGFDETEGTHEFIQALIVQDDMPGRYRLSIDPNFASLYMNVGQHPDIVGSMISDQETQEKFYAMNLMDYFLEMKMPLMVLRAGQSNLLTRDNLREMQERAGDTIRQIIEVPDIVHPVAQSSTLLNEKVLKFFASYGPSVR